MNISRKRHSKRLSAAFTSIFLMSSAAVAGPVVISSDIHDSHGTARLGVQNYTKTDGSQIKTGGASVLNFEYSRNVALDQALVFGFRQATDAATKRDAYHAAYGGYRLFPLGVGFPMVTTTGDATISLDSRYKPYAEASVGMGHILFETISDGAGSFNSDTLSFAFGGGMMMHFFSRWAVDFQLMYEMVQSRGGTGNALAVSGSNIYILLGSGMLF